MTSHPEPTRSSDRDSARPRLGATPRWRQLLRLALVALLALLAVRLVAGWSARVQLEQAVARVEAAGDSLRFSDFAPPDVDPGDNATEFLEAAGRLLTAQPTAEGGAALIDVLNMRWSDLDHQRQAPTSEDLALFRRVVDHHDLVLRVLDEGMSREHARFDVDYFVHDPATLDIPNLLRRLRLTRLLRARAWLALEDGRSDDAWADVARIFHLAGWLAEEMPTIIHSLVAQAVAREGLAIARDVLRTAPPSSDDMARVLTQARRWDPRAAHTRVLKAERAALFTTLLYEDGWDSLAGSLGPTRLNLGPWFLDVSYGEILASWPFKPWMTWNVVAYTEAMTGIIEACEPLAHQRHEGPRSSFDERSALPRWAALARRVLPNLIESCIKRDLLLADIDLMEIALRLAAHQRETGGYPAAHDLLPDVPALDPFSGEPYRYRLESDGAVVYSLAGNRTDDGGTPGAAGQAGGSRSIPELEAGDLVWRVSP